MIDSSADVGMLNAKLVELNNEYEAKIEAQKVIGKSSEELQKKLIDLMGEWKRNKLDIRRLEKEMQNTKTLINAEKSF